METADRTDRPRVAGRAPAGAATRWKLAPGVGFAVRPAGSPPRFLVHQARFHVGDTLWLTPLLRALGRRFPGARTTVVGPPVASRLLARSPWVERVVPYAPDGGPAPRAGVRAALEGETFDAALFGFARRPESRWLVDLARRLGAKRRIGLEYTLEREDHLPESAGYTHEGRLTWGAVASPGAVLRLAEPLCDPTDRRHRALLADARLELHAGEASRRRATELLALRTAGRPFVVLAPGGRSAGRWPPELFARLARRLHDRYGVTVLVDGAPSGRELRRWIVERARASGRGSRAIHPEETPLEVHYRLLQRAALLVSNDSAPVHLAAAAGCPTVYFTDRPRLVHSRPQGSLVRPLVAASREAVRAIPLATVEAAIAALVRGRRIDL